MTGGDASAVRVLFAGTPDFAVPSLVRLADEFEVVGVLTAPPRPRGRGRKPKPSPVAQAAESRSIPVLTPERLGRQARSQVQSLSPPAQLLVCVAYGRIFGPKFLALFEYGGINLHPSLLPKYRGPAPIPAVILAGETVTGITVQELALEMDAGDIIIQEKIPLDGSETAAALTEVSAARGAELLARAVSQIASGQARRQPQNHAEATYCGLLRTEDAAIDWNRSAELIDRQVRAYNPWPKAYTYLDDRRLSILEARVAGDAAGGDSGGNREAAAGGDPRESDSTPDDFRLGASNGAEPGRVLGIDSARGILVQTGAGILALERVQLQARSAMPWRDFINGMGDITGRRLFTPESAGSK